jgi:hypothetical protein
MKTVKAGLVVAALAAQWSLADGPPVGLASAQHGQVGAGPSMPPRHPDAAPATGQTAASNGAVALHVPVTP